MKYQDQTFAITNIVKLMPNMVYKKKRTPGNKNTYSNTQIYVPGTTAVNHMGGVGSHLG